MGQEQSNLKKPALCAIVLFVILLAGAFILYKERLFFADSSFQVFNVINYRQFDIAHYRYGAFIAQLLPWFGQNAHWSLKSILIAYDVTPNILFLLVASLIVYAFKEYKLAILMALYYTLIVSDSYFLGVEEMSQGAAWMFLLFAVTIYAGRKGINILWLLLPFSVLAFLTVSAHFILIIPITFLWIYLVIEKKNWNFSTGNTILLSSLLVGVVALKAIIAASDTYDQGHLHGLTHISLSDVIKAFTTPVAKMFVYRCLINYWVAILVFIAGLTSLIKSKQKLLAAWTLCCFVGYVILMGVTYGDLDKYVLLFHIELEWKSIAVILATPFVFTFLPSLQPKQAVLLLSAIFLIRLLYIVASIPKFHHRLQFENAIVARMKEKNIRKLALYDDEKLMSQYLLSWAIPYETLMKSALDGDKPQYTFIIVEPNDKERMDVIKAPDSVFLYDPVPIAKLNHEYFVADSTNSYQVMTYEQLFSQ